MACLHPPLRSIPEGFWYCPQCRALGNIKGCMGCRKDTDNANILLCDGKGCDLEWHM
ncbi:unnamed protein product [Discosporangium mesarthrocarpum]